jgi:dTDP-4-amino-4,6-dideoxygalactose transaminase
MTDIPLVDLRAQFFALRTELEPSIRNVLESMDLMLGPESRAFEQEFADYCRTSSAVGVGSGTDALYLALRAHGVGPGDEVITVANTFFATAEAIVQIGAVPVFVDVDPEFYTMDPTRLEAAITPRTRAVIPVHLYGQMADMDAIVAIARRHDLVVIEDACQAHGAEVHGRRAGSIGDSAAFSFYMSKNLGAYGEAGALTSNSGSIIQTVRRLRNHGGEEKYRHSEVGVNSRLDEVQAAILRVKLAHLDRWNTWRSAHASLYGSLLRDTDVVIPAVRPDTRHVFHLYVVQVPAGSRDQIRESLDSDGVATGVHYPIPLHLQPALNGVARVTGTLTVTEALASRIVSLPMYPELEAGQIERVVASLKRAVAAVSERPLIHA